MFHCPTSKFVEERYKERRDGVHVCDAYVHLCRRDNERIYRRFTSIGERGIYKEMSKMYIQEK